MSDSPRAALAERLRTGPALLLDGATGTELERMGLHTGLPLWSTHALIDDPDAVERVHRSYVDVGAEVITACTFRTQRRVLARAQMGDRAAALTRLAVDRARSAANAAAEGRRVWVAGSAPGLEDCYRPDLVPPEAQLAAEHAEHARNLADAGADLILAETHNTIGEARAAATAARDVGLPFFVSFVCGDDGRLLSGEPLGDAIDAARPLGPLAVGVNCLPPDAVHACLPTLASCGLPFGAYANLGAPNDETGFTRDAEATACEIAEHAARWLECGASYVGGCCGTGPDHVRELSNLLAR